MKLYGIPNCNTVKKARDWLDKQSINYVFHDFKKLGIDKTTLDHWLSQQPWENLINRAGMTWRKLSDIEKALIFLYLEDKPYKEIAITLGITEVNARVKMNRAKDKLKKSLNP